MSEVQGTIEFSVELHKFYNVDLFQRGYYQVRAALKISSRIPHRLIATTSTTTDESAGDSISTAAACVHDNTVFSRIFQILYRNEEIVVNDPMNFRVHLLLDGEKVEEALSEVDFQLKLDLHFTDTEQQLSDIATVPMISSRTLGLHFHPRRGLHHHVPVMFDYFHLSVISVTIHASLVALHQPLISFTRSGKGSLLGKGSVENGADQTTMSLENLMFGAGYCKPVITEGSFYVPSENCMQRAYSWHRRLCCLLLNAHGGLRTYYTGLMKQIPELPQTQIEELPIEETLTQLSLELQVQSSHDKVVEQISRDLTQLCSHLVALWSQFLGTVTLHPEVTSHLAQEHHTLRVRRFSEAYFFTEHHKRASLTFQEELIQRQNQIASEARGSDYLTKMPPLPAECLDIDGDWNTLPIIFEDRYIELPSVDEDLGSATPSVPYVPTANRNKEDKETTSLEESEMDRKASPTREHASGKPPINENLLRSSNCTDLSANASLSEGHEESNNNLKASDSLESSAMSNSQDNEPSASELEGRIDPTGGNNSSNTGLKYIEVRPSDADPYRGEAVLIVATSNKTESTDLNRAESLSLSCHSNELEEKEHEVNEPNEYESKSTKNLTEVTPHEGKLYENEDMLLFSLSVTDTSVSEMERTVTVPSKCEPAEKESYGAGKDGFTRSLRTMKRSSSVISDSGIESEPSSVAWLDVRIRPQDFSSERDLLHQLVRRHTMHRNSLEGCQTESNASLPSGIQASLTSISSLPYEEEVELSKLTKSVSAPQISSPEEDPETNQDPRQRGDESQSCTAVGGNIMRQNDRPVGNAYSLEDILEGDIPECLTVGRQSSKNEHRDINILEDYNCSKEINIPKILENQVVLCTVDAVLQGVPEAFLFKKYVGEELPKHTGTLPDKAVFYTSASSPITQENYKNDSVPNCDVQLDSQKVPHLSDQMPAFDFKEGDLIEGEFGSFLDSTNKAILRESDQCFHQIELNEEDRLERVHCHECQDIEEENGHDPKIDKCNDREHPALPSQGKSSNIPSSSLAFMNRKVVEVVNLSVSCAPTCLPFSSVLRDSPSVNGFSMRQATSPVTRQPLGSFGVISSNSFCVDEETNERMLNFYKAKDDLLNELRFRGTLYSDLPQLASDVPYFPPEEEEDNFEDGIHLVICVHGLDGNSADLRLVKTFIELGLPGSKLDFLMSERNQTDTFADFDTMTDRLLDEIIQHIQLYNLTIARISFIGHSLGNIIIRSVLTRPRFRYYLNKLHTFLSLSGPHLGTLYNNSTLVSTGLWLMQKLKKSGSLLQLTFRDHSDSRKTFLYLLSQKPGLQHFKNVVLVASPQDRYVPFHSARIEMCRTALKDRGTGPVYAEMINNLLQPLLDAKECNLIRQNVFHALPNTANTLIGRAAHIAVLDSELFLEKFFLVAGLHYFK
ncbi:protein FAM135B-like isoform X2 [Acipenser oxyrinchus oxyrinchus]|uniref:Protein FAM135B-like isoform X2 n=1 Tax=Acipenser oxyrinchus oxyrinchus TaxID=40147 RepID=A0AAD8GEM2_ACIOX|nr:protein FAM135B-like isoform X2 [Acipenser oxyrinchus oxyrinchus]